ncbi:MAG: hypothetical protein IT287_07090 [Bdellovibrionaceae bacterium]|nr:hypothetical protein [Pseudobdellovibrionaceae bacterium]
MGYFDGLTEASFKKNNLGQTLYYPWGVMGKGYLVIDNAREQQLRKFTKLNYLITLPVVIFNQVIFGVLPNLILLPIYIVTFIFLLRKYTSNLPVVTEKLGVKEAYRNSASRHSLTTLLALEVVAIAFVTMGILFIIEGRNTYLGIFAVALFGFTAIAIGYMSIFKIKNK